MTRAELRSRVGQAEFVDWIGFYSWDAQQQELAAKKARRGRS